MSISIASRYEILLPGDCNGKWDAYVSSHPKGTVFHTSGLLRAYASVPKHEVLAMAAQNDRGQIVAMLSAVKVSTLDGIASRLSSRSIWYAEPICDSTDEGVDALRHLIAEHDRKAKSCLFTEVRAIAAPADEQAALEESGYEFRDYLNFVVDTSSEVDTLFGRLSKSTRNKIRRSIKRGVEVEVDNTHHGIERMYAMVRESYLRSEVPLADEALFHASLDELVDQVQVRLATFEGRDVAGGIGLLHAGRFYAWYGGSVRLSGIVPFDCLTWDEIRWSSENQQKLYDFGGAGWPNEEYGPREFKRKFGGDLCHFGRYRYVPSTLKLRLAESAYKVARSVISK